MNKVIYSLVLVVLVYLVACLWYMGFNIEEIAWHTQWLLVIPVNLVVTLTAGWLMKVIFIEYVLD